MPKVWESCITLGALIGVLAIGIVIFKASVHVPMFLGVCVAAVMALYLGHKWDSIEKMMMDGIYKALQSVCILIIVGILVGVWINAGVVPTMIYYGLKIMHPAIFFIACVLICSYLSGYWLLLGHHGHHGRGPDGHWLWPWHESRYDRRRHPVRRILRR